ncbi:tRNA pseudouridine(65) synthase TruC [Mariprofundus sp. KV]|uniref:tRNA pseudouridine(65) synthase TruC n=1 Tax=Mariprofundus sp. KV TaxID=2608715 RepID=UPI0015A127F2|nr:tRNA pseudouridine(65) synthase TruC [Mariprofundus sp. KV]NWF35190.1 tRNA pseudouridine(65) synthase TruC [Mariprofundus sp. KV]
MLEILYRDEWLVAINKPADLLVHRSMIDRHETRFAMQMLRDQIGQHVFPVHRLDKPTSGVLLFALNSESARKIADVFTARDTQKTYLAIVRGFTDEQGVIDYPLKEELDKKSDRKAQQDKEAQEAVTEYRRLATVELPYAVGRYQTARYSLLHLTPKTGRKHQLRRHLKHLYHPIVGDTTHGDGKQNSFFRERLASHRLLLHATGLGFIHPETDQLLQINAPLPPSFKNIVDALGWVFPVDESRQPEHQL